MESSLNRRPSPMQSYYAARAGEYDAVYRKPERQPDLRRIERWLPDALSGRSLLEVACGTGYWTRFLAPVVPSILAIDSAAETLKIAGARVTAANVTFEIGDAYDLRSGGRVFDGAFAGFWFSHVPIERRSEFLRGLGAVLRPDAKVVLLDNRFVEGSSSPISERDAMGNAYQARKLGDGSVHRVLKNFPTEAELLGLVEGTFGRATTFTGWPYFWALEYRVPGA